MNKEQIMEMAKPAIKIPFFLKGLFVVSGINFYEAKSSKKLYLSIGLNMIEWSEPDGDKVDDEGEVIWKPPVRMIRVDRMEDGTLTVDYPYGKDGTYTTLMAFQSQFKFVDDDSGEWFTISAEKFDKEYFADFYTKEHPSATVEEFDQAYTDHIKDLMLFRAQKQLLINTPPQLGMSTTLYKTYSPPEKDQKYGNSYVSKFKQGYPALSGEYELISEDIVEAIISAAKADKDTPGEVPF